MGEIMRWRQTRGAQRRVPATQTIAQLPDPFRIDPNLLNAQPDAVQAAIMQHSAVLSDPLALRRYLTTGRGGAALPANPNLNAGVIRIFVALLRLDEWLAANAPPPTPPPFTTPTVAALNQQINRLLGQPLPAAWQSLRQIITDLYYVALILSAWGVPFSLTKVLGLLTRWLLVIRLVDDLQLNPSPIQTPDDIFSALRWRTLVLPDIVSLVLMLIRIRNQAVLVRNPGFADLYITREEWDHYEPAEIASIENILKSEVKSRVHILVNQSQVTTTTEQSTTQLKEQDTTTTDLTQLQQQSSSDISLAVHVDGQVNTSGQYGATKVDTHLGGSLDYSTHDATSRATTQSHETVSRAISKIEQATRQVRTVSTLTREKDKEEHTFDNKQGTGPVVGIYRWVDQIQNVELDRYPHRFLMEFEIPEPGAWTRWLWNSIAGRNMINQPPAPLTIDGKPIRPPDPGAIPPDPGNPLLKASDITAGNAVNPGNYLDIAKRYLTTGIIPPPNRIIVALTLSAPSSAGGSAIGPKSDSSLTVPNGYYACSYEATAVAVPRTNAPPTPNSWSVRMIVGAGEPKELYSDLSKNPPEVTRLHNVAVGSISQGIIPVALEAVADSYELNIEVTCNSTDQTYQQWQEDTYALIVGAYNAMLQAYNDEKAGLSIQKTNLADANSPAQNSQIVKQELRRQTIEMLIGKRFRGRNAISWDKNGTLPDEPTTDLVTAANIAPEVQFLEQAFEWETLSYICYPPYWADASRWLDLSAIEGSDANFADFLRAGSARVVLAARPGFEDQVNLYIQCGILWGGGPMPAPGDPDYLSIADEIKNQQQRPRDVTVIDTWQVRLPTTLIWLVNQNPDGQLPKNLNPTIDTSPKIVGLSPVSGKVRDSVTIAGRNFGDIQGSSTVSFNRTNATPTNWGATSIDVNVPVGAATGNVVVTVRRLAGDGVTVNSVESSGVNFTVN